MLYFEILCQYNYLFFLFFKSSFFFWTGGNGLPYTNQCLNKYDLYVHASWIETHVLSPVKSRSVAWDVCRNNRGDQGPTNTGSLRLTDIWFKSFSFMTTYHMVFIFLHKHIPMFNKDQDCHFVWACGVYRLHMIDISLALLLVLLQLFRWYNLHLYYTYWYMWFHDLTQFSADVHPSLTWAEVQSVNTPVRVCTSLKNEYIQVVELAWPVVLILLSILIEFSINK